MESSQEIIQFKKLHSDAIIPTRGTPYSIGFDLYALEDTMIVGGAGNVLVPTGIAIQMPLGTYGRIAPRSGLSVRQHMCCSAGVIDIDYTGGIGVVIFSTKLFDLPAGSEKSPQAPDICNIMLKPHSYLIRKGEKFAQLIVERASYADALEVEDFAREYTLHAGYGSTGTGLPK